MSEALSTHVGPWTLDDLPHLPDDGQRYEIIDGSLLVSPPLTPARQAVAARIHRLLAAAVRPQLEVLEGVGVQTAERRPGARHRRCVDVRRVGRCPRKELTGGDSPSLVTYRLVRAAYVEEHRASRSQPVDVDWPVQLRLTPADLQPARQQLCYRGFRCSEACS